MMGGLCYTAASTLSLRQLQRYAATPLRSAALGHSAAAELHSCSYLPLRSLFYNIKNIITAVSQRSCIAARLRRYGRVTFWNFVYNSAETNIVIRKLYNYSSKGTSDVEPEAVGHIVSSG